MNRLDYFLNKDAESRDRITRLSTIGVIVLGGLIEAMGVPFITAAYISLGLGAACFSVQVWSYCKYSIPVRLRPYVFARNRRYALASVPLAILAFISNSKSLQATLLNERLLRLSSSKESQLSEKQIAGIGSAIQLAAEQEIDLNSVTLGRIEGKLNPVFKFKSTTQNGEIHVGRAVAAFDPNYFDSPELREFLQNKGSQPEFDGLKWSFRSITSNGPSNAYTFGSTATQPNVARMQLLTDPEVNGAGPTSMFVSQSRFKLDRYSLKRVVIQRCTVFYDGGPIMLEDVYFPNSTLSIAPTKNGVRLLASIRAGHPVTFFAE